MGTALTDSPRIAVVGSAVTDLTTFTDVFPRPGETLFGKGFDLGFGGKGANQAVAARLCGAEVMMVAKVGDDLFGQATIDNFVSFGIDTTHVHIVEGAPTGVAPIFVEPNGQNRIIVVKGANDRLTPADVDAAAPDLERVDAIILQFEIPLETIYHTIRFARAHNIRCIVNPAPAVPANLAELAGADYFIPNETEAELLTGLPVRSDGRGGGVRVRAARQGVSAGRHHLGRARFVAGRCRRAHARAALSGHSDRYDGRGGCVYRQPGGISGRRPAGAGSLGTRESLRRPVDHPDWNPKIVPAACRLRDGMVPAPASGKTD